MADGFVLGYDEAGSGDVLLLVHGFPLDRRMWAGQLKGLSDIRRVVAVDLRGRGKSPFDDLDGSKIDDYADDVAATIDSLGVEKVDLAGLSMGGYVVMSMWKRHPEKIRSLILIDTKSQADTPEAQEAREKTAALVREKGTVELVNALFPKMFGPGVTEEVKTAVQLMFEETPADTAATDALAMKDRDDSTTSIATIAIPALVLHGRDDSIMPIDGARSMAALIPRSKFVEVPGGHMSPTEHPEEVNSEIRGFLTSLDA